MKRYTKSFIGKMERYYNGEWVKYEEVNTKILKIMSDNKKNSDYLYTRLFKERNLTDHLVKRISVLFTLLLVVTIWELIHALY